MNTELVPIDDLTPDPANARKHGERNLSSIIDSLRAFGQQKPIVVDRRGVVIAGNGTLEAAKRLGWEEIAVVRTELDPTQATAFGIADNRTAELAEWDEDVLVSLLDSLDDETRDLLHFDEKELEAMVPKATVEVVEDEVPDEVEPRTKPGDLWLLGRHRLLCGDSTNAEDVARLFAGATATMVHADPPYGMGKEKDGVANDNLYREKLDAFQMEWWRVWRPHLPDNGSAYIWGNAPDLWRLWYCGGLSESERMTIRNEIVWDKGGAAACGISLEGSEGPRRYPSSTERCLFFMLGEQGFNMNADNYWDGWEPIRAYLDGERKKCGWSIPKTKEIAGHSPKSGCHWFDRSQWSMPTEETYRRWQEAAKGHDAFKRDHDELKRDHDELKRDHDELKAAFYETRAHFDNTHDNMTDVWSFGRVVGEERGGHATPKPVEMVARAIKSSSQEGDAIAVPFGGTGPEIIAAEQLNRTAYAMELEPQYCDVIVRRWENLTGETAVLEA
jgi:DNA modification methylase